MSNENNQQQEENNNETNKNQTYKYNTGFGNNFSTSALPNSLPQNQNNPLQCPYNLYAEQISGTAFTVPRGLNKRTWMYRCLPSVAIGSSNGDSSSTNESSLWKKMDAHFGGGVEDDGGEGLFDPNPLRWFPIPANNTSLPKDGNSSTSFIHGIKQYAMSSNHPSTKDGVSIYLYAFNGTTTNNNKNNRECLVNSDGDFLIVPQQGTLLIQTEMGMLEVRPKEICVIPRGIIFSVCSLKDDNDDDGNGDNDSSNSKDFVASGYILEIYKGHFELPELGPIGSNGLANPRDFQYPIAYFDHDNENKTTNPNTNYIAYNKYANQFYKRITPHSPYNVVSWHGNYAPFKYNLEHFCTINSVSYDHPDPSIYTVLTAKSDEVGTALADFVIFPPRWCVMEHTFRPPYFHRNCMTEFMGMIYGSYDAKSSTAFLPGGASLHPCMTPHGPDYDTYKAVVEQDAPKANLPVKIDAGLAFMFETNLMLKVTKYAHTCDHRDLDYVHCWNGFKHSLSK